MVTRVRPRGATGDPLTSPWQPPGRGGSAMTDVRLIPRSDRGLSHHAMQLDLSAKQSVHGWDGQRSNRPANTVRLGPALQRDVAERASRAPPCRVLPPRSDDHGRCRSERAPTEPLAEAAPTPSPRKLDAGRWTRTCGRTCAPIPADPLQDPCCFPADSDSTSLLPKQNVEGSNPFSRSKSLPQDNSGPALAP